MGSPDAALLVTKGMWTVTDPAVEDDDMAASTISEQALALFILGLGEDQMMHVESCKMARHV